MPWRVTLQLPVKCHAGRCELFVLKNVEIPVEPHEGLKLMGGRIPSAAVAPESDLKNVITQVIYDFDTGVIYATLMWLERPTDEWDEVLEELRLLDSDWARVPPAGHGMGRLQSLHDHDADEEAT